MQHTTVTRTDQVCFDSSQFIYNFYMFGILIYIYIYAYMFIYIGPPILNQENDLKINLHDVPIRLEHL